MPKQKNIRGERNFHLTTLLSFDVGIRNLSFCVLRQMFPEDIIDLIDDNQVDEVRETEKEISLYSSISLQNWGCIDIPKENNSNVRNVNTLPIDTLVRYTIRSLDDRFRQQIQKIMSEDQKIRILIENQPNRSLRMNVVSYTIVSYFETLFTLGKNEGDISCAKKRNMKIEMVSAKKKLILCDQMSICKKNPNYKPRKKKNHDSFDDNLNSLDGKKKSNPKKKITKKKKNQEEYRNNKWRAVEGCKKLLDEVCVNEEMKNLFYKSKKKDDLSDSFLQGIYVLSNSS